MSKSFKLLLTVYT